MHHPYLWKVCLQTISNQTTSFCKLLQSSSKKQPEKKANSLTKPKWKIKMSKNSYIPKERANPHCLEEESSNCLDTPPAHFHLLVFRETQLPGSLQLQRRKDMCPKCLDDCSRKGPTRRREDLHARLHCKSNNKFSVCYAKPSEPALLTARPHVLRREVILRKKAVASAWAGMLR